MGFYIEELPTELNGITMKEAVYWADIYLQDNPCDRMWDAMRALRDFYETVTSEAVEEADRKTEPTISKMEQVEDEPQTCSFSDCDNFKNPDYARCIECKRKQIKLKDEPQTNADQHVQRVGSVGSVEPTWTKEEHEAFYTFLWNVINPNEMQDYIEMFETKDEPQMERSE